MSTILSVLQVLIAMAMIGIILVQRGPGAAAGSGFGGGASGTVFGSRGSGTFLTRTTAILAASFFAISILMAMLVSRAIDPTAEQDIGVMQGVVEERSGADDVPAFESNEAPVIDLEVPPATGDSAQSAVPVAQDESLDENDIPAAAGDDEGDQ